MTRDDILRMARDAGLHEIASPLDKVEYRSNLERFAALVAAAEREARQSAQHQVAELQERLNRADAERCAAVLVERDECAKVCMQSDEHGEGPDCWDWHAKDYAAAIRARGKT